MEICILIELNAKDVKDNLCMLDDKVFVGETLFRMYKNSKHRSRYSASADIQSPEHTESEAKNNVCTHSAK